MEAKFTEVAQKWSGDPAVTVHFQDEIVSADGIECIGVYSSQHKTITLQLGMDSDQLLSCFLHELGHAVQQRNARYDPDNKERLIAKHGKEAVERKINELYDNLESQAEFFSRWWLSFIPPGTLEARLNWMLENIPE